jgi:nucleotide-binding universal stress UspA family protein
MTPERKGVTEMYNRILVASDGSGPSMHAARAAALIAKAVSAKLTVLTVASLPEQYKDDLSEDLEEGFIDEWRKVLEMTVAEVKRHGIEPESRLVRDKKPVPAIIAELESGGYDLLAIGRTGTGKTASKTMGSISDKLISEVICSLLVAH